MGNKANEGARAVSESQAREFANDYSLDYHEISVKNGSKINELF